MLLKIQQLTVKISNRIINNICSVETTLQEAIMHIPRPEYPRPQFERNSWYNLNGEWNFAFDDSNVGIKSEWYKNPQFNDKIVVPYVYQSKLSGINKREFHDIVWYSKGFAFPEEMADKRIILHFGAVDYIADVWVNGLHCTSHEGGHVSFSCEITDLINQKENLIVVRVQDFSKDLSIPRGKQYWKPYSESIFYTGTTGIWQTVWLECLNETYIEKIWITPDLDQRCATIEYEINGWCKDLILEANVLFKGQIVSKSRINALGSRGKFIVALDNRFLDYDTSVWYDDIVWSPENPVLFDVELSLFDAEANKDEVKSYFGLRKVSVKNGKFMLNNKPYYQKMILDQGYWEDSLLTAPTDSDFVKDIELCKRMGFNGARKHQKVEDPRYLYWADRMGFLVWGEMANAFSYSRQYAARMTNEWLNVLERDYNHPCIVVWTPLNESWGVPNILNNQDEQAHSVSLYWLTKSIDQTRPVISNDGWEHTKSDLLTLHDYEHKGEVLRATYSSIEYVIKTRRAERGAFAEGWHYEDQPLIISEFGGISYKKSEWKGWGYSNASSDDDFATRYYEVVSALLESANVQGFVYTQITDVEQEINGLLTYRREPKIDLDIIKQINEGKWKPQ